MNISELLHNKQSVKNAKSASMPYTKVCREQHRTPAPYVVGNTDNKEAAD